jgi:predicted MFS family arabinose efflux permease
MDRLETVSFNSMMALLGISAAMMTSAGTFSPLLSPLILSLASLLSPVLCFIAGMGILGGNLHGALKNRAVAVLAAGQSVGFIFGLLSAGFLCSLERGWRYIFVLQAALGMIFVLMAVVSVPKDTVKYDRELDWLGVVLSTSGLVLFIFALS